MQTKSVHLKLPESLYAEISEVKNEFGFLNIQEFIKEAARKALYEYHKQKALKTLKKFYGSTKNIKRLTREEKDKLAMELTPEEGERLFKKFGLR